MVVTILILGGSLLLYITSQREVQNTPPEEVVSGDVVYEQESDSDTQILPTQTENKPPTTTSRRYEFLQYDPTVIQDPVNLGNYILYGDMGYCIEGTPCTSSEQSDFSITYSAVDESFTIVLYQKPLDKTRERAETFLNEKILVHKNEMCGLRYSIAVPYWVDEFNSGKNLKFSFCPEAVQL